MNESLKYHYHWVRTDTVGQWRSNLVVPLTRQRIGNSLFCCCTASMEQATDGAETAAIDRLVSSWSENIFVSFCLRAPRYRLTLCCALGLLVGGAIPAPQLQLQQWGGQGGQSPRGPCVHSYTTAVGASVHGIGDRSCMMRCLWWWCNKSNMLFAICWSETPLTLAVTLAKPQDIILMLIDGGALLDFRSRTGLTPMHVAAKLGSCEAVKVCFCSLLEHFLQVRSIFLHEMPSHLAETAI